VSRYPPEESSDRAGVSVDRSVVSHYHVAEFVDRVVALVNAVGGTNEPYLIRVFVFACSVEDPSI
jgi:hypothetical protein